MNSAIQEATGDGNTTCRAARAKPVEVGSSEGLAVTALVDE
jgi:hypothetical protein